MATEQISFRSDVTVELVRGSASDADVVFAARVSTAGEQSLDDVNADAEGSAGLINYLMRERHGSPFEHNSMTFFVQAPIFMWREHFRHRMASYNEESGRYKVLEPVFYVPDADLVRYDIGREVLRADRVVTGEELAGWGDERVVAELPSLHVVARSTPDGKERLVRLARAATTTTATR